jgi:pimeloyl-ACP methyl ester carboxylesterase
MLAGFMYRANGPGKHPTMLLLHGFPGNERNPDLAQAIRGHGWNVVYFDYRGSWGSGGKFSFKNCVDDVIHAVAYCKQYQDSLKIDTSNMVLFGHSMGGWVSLKALQQLPGIKKCFALSAWDIYPYYKRVLTQSQVLAPENGRDTASMYFVLNSTVKQMFDPVLKDTVYYDLANDGQALAHKQIVIHSVIASLDGPDKTNSSGTPQGSEAQIRTARASSNEAIARQDADGIVRDMPADYSIVTGRGRQAQGKDSLRAFWQEAFKRMPGVTFGVVRGVEKLNKVVDCSSCALLQLLNRSLRCS